MPDNRPLCYVIIPFSGFDDVMTAIRTVAENTGFCCLRADEGQHGIVHQEIIEKIVTAKAIIADVSERNANVMYELGIAHALGSNVVAISRQGTEFPFDIQPTNIITYTNDFVGASRLGTELEQRLVHLRDGGLIDNIVQHFLANRGIRREIEIVRHEVRDLLRGMVNSRLVEMGIFAKGVERFAGFGLGTDELTAGLAQDVRALRALLDKYGEQEKPPLSGSGEVTSAE